MTTVLARLTVPSSGAAASGWVPAHEAPSRGHLDCCPYAPAGARRHEESPDRIVLPAAFVAKLVDGEATLQLAPTAAWWCWQIIERTARGATRYVAVPDSPTVVDYADLVDVDPATLAPTEAAVPAWEAVVDAVSASAASAGASAQDAHADMLTTHADMLAADASADAAALSEAVAGLAVISINPSPDYAGTVLRITYPSHLSPAPHLIRLPIGV